MLRLHLFPMWVRLLCLAVALPISIACVWGGYFLGHLLSGETGAIVFMFLGVLVSLFASQRLMVVLNRWMIGRVPGSTALNGEATLALDEDGVHYTTEVSDTVVRWTGISHIFSRRGTLFFATGLSAYYLPARCFSSEAARREAIEFALARMTPEARARSKP